MKTSFRPSIVLLALMSILTGFVYPATVTAVAQAVFPEEANGSLIRRAGRIVGSRWIGQSFDDTKYFWSRPSATIPRPYDGGASSGSNAGPSNPALRNAVATRAAALRAADPTHRALVPVDLVTASGSGLDPHITPASARYQIDRVARARGLPYGRVAALVDDYVEGRLFGVLGEPRVNVLELNLALDSMAIDRR